MKKKINIAIVGLGNIGSYLFKYLQKNKSLLTKKNNSIPNIIFVSAKNKNKKRSINIKKNIWVQNYLDITKSSKVDLIVELIGGSDGAAKKLVFAALRNKKHVVTANKALIAKYGDQLAKIAEKNRVNLEYEAAVCGGVPVIRSIKEGLIANKVNKIYGILNGTSNFILSDMETNNLSFLASLNKAKKKGYAETNPTSDLNGDDVASKLKILSSLCFNTFTNNQIHIEGIKNIDIEDINNAGQFGYKIKLLAYAQIIDKKLCQRVHPVLIRKKSYLAGINGVLNAVVIDAKPVGQSIIQGEGAGAEATTSALISDISSILRGNIKYPFSISNRERKLIKNTDISNIIFSAYIRIEVIDRHGVLSNVTKIFASNKVSIKRLIQNPHKNKKISTLVIITHETKDLLLTKTINNLSKKKFVLKKVKFIRIDNN
jgi:homoserine dehydrogenase